MMKIQWSESFWKVMGLLSSIFQEFSLAPMDNPTFEDLS